MASKKEEALMSMARSANFLFAFQEKIQPDKHEHTEPYAGWVTKGGALTSYSIDTCFVDRNIHYKGLREFAERSDQCWSRGSPFVHSTRLRALQALRQIIEIETLEQLRRIDDMISAEIANPTPPLEPAARHKGY